MDQKYHIFIAYGSADRVYAKSFYEILCEKYEVFFDWACLLPGDAWDITLPNAQKNSLITIVLISRNADNAFYQKEEIASAIALSKNSPNNHRVIPIYLDNDIFEENIPYGLRRLHSIKMDETTSIPDACIMVSKALDEMAYEKINKRSPFSKYEEQMNAITDLEILRFGFIETIDNKIKKARFNDKNISLLYLDIDSFTGLNNHYGISIGNEVVKAVNNVLANSFDKNSFVRWGGDSFLCIFESNMLAEKIAEIILGNVYGFDWEAIAPRLYATVSIGIVDLSENDNATSLMKRAMEGARRAKKQGGNKVMAGPLSEGRISPKRNNISLKDVDDLKSYLS